MTAGPCALCNQDGSDTYMDYKYEVKRVTFRGAGSPLGFPDGTPPSGRFSKHLARHSGGAPCKWHCPRHAAPSVADARRLQQGPLPATSPILIAVIRAPRTLARWPGCPTPRCS
jgi:hypothetical protein